MTADYRARDLPLYLCTRVFTTIAVMVQSVAVGWQIYDLERTPLALGWVGLAQFVPMFALTLPAGEVVDRTDPRRVLALALLLQAACAGALLALSLTHGHGAWLFYLVLLVFGCARGFSGPAGQSLAPFLVPPALLTRTIAWAASAYQLAVIAGPAVGGVLYAAGPAVPYAVCLAGFGAAGLITLGLGGRRRAAGTDAAADSTRVERVREGIAFVRSRPVVLGAISLDLFAVLLGGATALLPVYARDILRVGPQGLGALRSAPAVGAALVALYLTWRPIRRRTGGIMFGAVALFGVATIVFGLSRSVWLSGAALIILGASDQISVFVRHNLVQLSTPDAMRGRVSAVNVLFIGASNELGEFESGVTAALFGTVPAVVLGGVGTLAVVWLWMRLFPRLRDVDRLDAQRAAA
ncbi:MAG TPA: MFS transporter [Steroidobacteraceae bacterium]|nr:MFS transporter [Steroidobacteraceae bacterium]